MQHAVRAYDSKLLVAAKFFSPVHIAVADTACATCVYIRGGHLVSVHPNSLSIHITFDVITTRAPAQGNKNMIKIVIFRLTH